MYRLLLSIVLFSNFAYSADTTRSTETRVEIEKTVLKNKIKAVLLATIAKRTSHKDFVKKSKFRKRPKGNKARNKR
jgi:hypothetical protein